MPPEIKTDLNKSNRYKNEMNLTIVLDPQRDANFSSIMSNHCDSLEQKATKSQETDAAQQIFNDLRQNYNFFVRITGNSKRGQ